MQSEGRAPGAPTHDNGNGNGNGDEDQGGRGITDRGRSGPGETARGRPTRGRRPTAFNDERQIFRLEGFDTHGTHHVDVGPYGNNASWLFSRNL